MIKISGVYPDSYQDRRAAKIGQIVLSSEFRVKSFLMMDPALRP